MHKMVILVEQLEDNTLFEELWPQFLHLVERMPGLRRETTSHVDGVLYGRDQYTLVHELYFDTLPAVQEAMISSEGRAAGELLQRMTSGRMTLLVADHKEDELDNIRKFKEQETGIEGSNA